MLALPSVQTNLGRALEEPSSKQLDLNDQFLIFLIFPVKCVLILSHLMFSCFCTRVLLWTSLPLLSCPPPNLSPTLPSLLSSFPVPHGILWCLNLLGTGRSWPFGVWFSDIRLFSDWTVQYSSCFLVCVFAPSTRNHSVIFTEWGNSCLPRFSLCLCS